MSFRMRLSRCLEVVCLMAAVASPTIALAHGDGFAHRLPGESVSGIERGVQAALACDHAIHELLGEYEVCLRSNHDYIGTDAAAETAFQFVAWLRASGAARNGYPDGPHYRSLYAEAYRIAQRQHAIAPARLCAALEIDCDALPESPPSVMAERRQ